ncbi:MAG: 30S ribosomal protein S3 [Patescibacteria group bacterium]|nr:MAG: 30S ribosomal protein S3 [Patescibacteria group bacterium]
MGHKVNPKVFRIGTIYSWDSKWFSRGDYKANLRQDVEIREFLRTALREAAVDKIEIDRGRNQITITIHSGKPGFVIGRGGTGIEDLKKKLADKFFSGSKKSKVQLNIVEVARPSLSAAITVQNMIADLEKRMPFRRVLKTTIDRAQKAGALGVKVMVSGRLNGAEIARREMLSWGSVPLQNLRADIDYAADFARTIFGAIGVKVWIYRGEIFDKDGIAPALKAPLSAAERAYRDRPRGGGDRRPAPRAAAPKKAAA